jgi:holliday junction DNA helicase RuvA
LIARLSGVLIQKSIMNCLLDVNGTGYFVIVPLSTFYELPDIGSPVVLNTYMQVRDDSISLYGFITQEERDAFQMMISVSGIGPKLAVNILSGITAGEWFRAVSGQDIKRLTVIPGVGRKTAERMVLELKEKIEKLNIEQITVSKAVFENSQFKDDVFSALINLGYKSSIARDTVEKIIKKGAVEPLSIDQILKEALRILSV